MKPSLSSFLTLLHFILQDEEERKSGGWRGFSWEDICSVLLTWTVDPEHRTGYRKGRQGQDVHEERMKQDKINGIERERERERNKENRWKKKTRTNKVPSSTLLYDFYLIFSIRSSFIFTLSPSFLSLNSFSHSFVSERRIFLFAHWTDEQLCVGNERQ